MITFTAYYGATELAPQIEKIYQKIMYNATGDFGYIFDIEGFILKLLGIEIPSIPLICLIFVIFIISFVIQKNKATSEGIPLDDSVYIVDDRNL